MKKTLTPVMLGFLALAILLLLYFYFTGKQKRFNWYESYKAESDQPYGTLYTTRMLQTLLPERKFFLNSKIPVQQLLPNYSKDSSAAYVFVGDGFYPDNDEIKALLDFVDAGNEAFIAARDLPDTVAGYFNLENCVRSKSITTTFADSVKVNFYNETLRAKKDYEFTYRTGSRHAKYDWKSFNDSIFCTASAATIPLGYQRPGHVNFIRLAHGKGFIYIHTDPILFTNYFIIRDDKMEYATRVFSHLNAKSIVWDEYSKLPWTGTVSNSEGPLAYFLLQPSLKYAWWLMLVTVLLYVLFAARRKQRVIQVLEPKTNTSLEFIYLISALHLQNGNPLDMARKKMKYFLYFIRSRYGIHAQTFKEEHMMRIAEKSKVNISEIKTIFDQYYSIEHNAYYNTQTDKLVSLFDAIENFNSKCK